MRDRFPLKEKFNNAISDGTIPTVFPTSPFNAAVERMGYKTGVSPRSNFKRIRGYRTIPRRRVFGAVRKGARFIYVLVAGRQEERI